MPRSASAAPRGASGSLTQDIKRKATDQFARMAETAADQFGNVADQAEQLANLARAQSRAAGARVQELAANFQGAVGKSLKRQPRTTLMMAAAVGFILGALWKS